jgi:competence protein ComEC
MLLGVAFMPPTSSDTLDIYVIDAEGGKAIIVRSPGGTENMLVDAGYPGNEDRDTKRIVGMARSLGITHFDWVVATHYDTDHSRNIPSVDALIPSRAFVDHGDPMPSQSPEMTRANYDPYIKAIGDRPRIVVKPGMTIAFKGVKITVLTAGGDTIAGSLSGAIQPNALCEKSQRSTRMDTDDNAGSVGLLYEFGGFRMLDLADLLQSVEWNLVCPENRIGEVDLFMVSHHGYNYSNSRVLVHAIRAQTAIMNNGRTKGGQPDVFDVVTTAPGFEDLWQMHKSTTAGAKNVADENFIANVNTADPCAGHAIRVSVSASGSTTSYTITNLRNGFSMTYVARSGRTAR